MNTAKPENVDLRCQDDLFTVTFAYFCPKCEQRHTQRDMQEAPITMVTILAPCGYSDTVTMPWTEPE